MNNDVEYNIGLPSCTKEGWTDVNSCVLDFSDWELDINNVPDFGYDEELDAASNVLDFQTDESRKVP